VATKWLKKRCAYVKKKSKNGYIKKVNAENRGHYAVKESPHQRKYIRASKHTLTHCTISTRAPAMKVNTENPGR
jgi:hypothetical protein